MELVEQKLVKWSIIALLIKKNVNQNLSNVATSQIHVFFVFVFVKIIDMLCFYLKAFYSDYAYFCQKKKSPELVQMYSANYILLS